MCRASTNGRGLRDKRVKKRRGEEVGMRGQNNNNKKMSMSIVNA